MVRPDRLEKGRASFERHAWADSHTELAEAKVVARSA